MTTASTAARTEIRPRRTGFVHDTVSIARRAIRQLLATDRVHRAHLVHPAVLPCDQRGLVSEAAAFVDLGITYEEFQLPVAIVFASHRCDSCRCDGARHPERLFRSLDDDPRLAAALLLGHMVADFVLVVALSVPVMILGFFMGARFDTGPLGVLVFVLIGALWGLGYTGIPYAICPQDEPGSGELVVHHLLPVRLLDHRLPSGREPQRMAVDRVDLQPGDLRPRRSSLLFIGWDAPSWARRCSQPSPSQRSPRRFRCSPSGSDVAEVSVPR